MKGNWFKIVLILVILILGYLFALNGRYEKMNVSNPNIFIDKWTMEIVEIVKVKSNGQD